MSTIVSSKFCDSSFAPGSQEIRFGIAAVLVFIASTCLYCLTYQAWVAAVTPNVTRTITIAFKEWGIWLLMSPVAFGVFRFLDERAWWIQQMLAGISLALIAAVVPTVLDQLSGTRPVGSSLAIFWPRFIAMALVIHLLWRVFLRRVPQVAREAIDAAPVIEPLRPQTLLVSKGADQCLIRLSDIQHASAAGNYIELCARNQRYLIRSTMGKLEALLAPSDYVRIHRSHLVRVDQIERIHTHRSSNGIVHLRSGHTLPLSKGCRSELLRSKIEPTAGSNSSR